MSIASVVGSRLPAYVFDVERSQLRLFAKAIGDTDAIRTDVKLARAAGYRDLPAAPTFAFSIAMNPDRQFDMLEAIDADLPTVLHGAQSFEYFETICAGDRVKVERTFIEAYEKKAGALAFYVVEAMLTDAIDARCLCRSLQTIAVRRKASA